MQILRVQSVWIGWIAQGVESWVITQPKERERANGWMNHPRYKKNKKNIRDNGHILPLWGNEMMPTLRWCSFCKNKLMRTCGKGGPRCVCAIINLPWQRETTSWHDRTKICDLARKRLLCLPLFWGYMRHTASEKMPKIYCIMLYPCRWRLTNWINIYSNKLHPE